MTFFKFSKRSLLKKIEMIHCSKMADDEEETESLLSLFDSLCVSYGDDDTIVRLHDDAVEPELVSYIELQLISQSLAYQLQYRFRPDYVLIDCFGHASAEAATILACLRLSVPFIPVSVQQGNQGRLQSIVDTLKRSRRDEDVAVVAVCCVPNDMDPRLGVFYAAGVHQILFVNPTGYLEEQIPVPQQLPPSKKNKTTTSLPNTTVLNDDAMYVLFTSGTSGNRPKAVVGSHRSTYRRLEWFRKTFDPSPRIARRTPLTFVDGVTELLGALLEPASLLVTLADPEELQAHGVAAFFSADRRSPSQITLLPSQLEQLFVLLASSKQQPIVLTGLERIIVSGEPCTERLYRAVRSQLPQCQLINLYGQTETTGDALCAVLTDLEEEAVVVDGIVAVGRPIIPSILCTTATLLGKEDCSPIPETNSKQLDGKSTLQGELVITGNLSRGYMTTDGETGHQRSPWKVFATGDVGFCQRETNSDSEEPIWYVKGRKDDVEKIDGVWTSPTEVEMAFSNVYPMVDRVAATIVNRGVYAVVVEPSDVRWEFSREHMHQAGLPWNLIPQQVFLREEIPTSRTGAGKVDRAGLKVLVQKLLAGAGDDTTPQPLIKDAADDVLGALVAKILNLSSVDKSKSFVNLGGNSASAVTLLYHLKNTLYDKLPSDITAVDILLADSLAELNAIIRGETQRKRRKIQPNSFQESFHPHPPLVVSDLHTMIQFRACVDASPVFSPLSAGSSFFAGCQGGVVQRISTDGGRVLSSHHFSGWMIQANILTVLVDSVIICGSNGTGQGMIASLDLDLKEINWRKDIEAGIKSTPVLVDGLIQVQAGGNIRRIDASSGCEKGAAISLPAHVSAKGAAVAGMTVYLSDDYECGQLLVLDDKATSIKLVQPSSSAIGPVYKDPVVVDDSTILVADSWGSLHLIETSNWRGFSLHISSSSLGPPSQLTEDKFLVGSYDGHLYCVRKHRDSDQVQLLLDWTVDVGATIYTKALALATPNSCIVCTTAGHVVFVKDGKVTKTYRIAAEIWSDPVLVYRESDQVCVGFGARDSRVHIITIG